MYTPLFFLCAFLVLSCNKATTVDIQETGQQVGDAMASLDESTGGSATGALGTSRTESAVFKRLGWEAPVRATACVSADTFSSCSSNVITRTFGDCTVGPVTFSGTVTLTWSDAASDSTCRMAAQGHTITRVPAFTATGRRGATLTVSKTGTNGQVITRGATTATYSLTSDGIRRVFTAGGATLFDYTTQTTSAITVTGILRANRTMSGGNLRVTNNLTSVYCDYAPTDVAWSSTCNCATSGSWAGTCSDGTTTTLTLTGCGTATLAIGSDSESVTFDRCYGF